jgi:hypothetical protein
VHPPSARIGNLSSPRRASAASAPSRPAGLQVAREGAHLADRQGPLGDDRGLEVEQGARRGRSGPRSPAPRATARAHSPG